MSYLGTAPRFGDYPVKTFTGNGVLTSFTLDHSVPSDAAIIVTIDGVRQHVGSYTAAGGTTLDFGVGNAPANLTAIEVIHLGLEATLNTPADNSVTAAKIIAGAVGASELDTTGTPDGTKYLRDDMQWEDVPAGSPTGSSGEAIFFNNENSVDYDYTVPTNTNSMSAGPVSINAVVTLSSGATWTIV